MYLQLLILYSYAGALASTIIRPRARLHPAADALWPLKTTGTYQMAIEDEVMELCITRSVPLKGKVRVMYMKFYDVINDHEGIGLPAVQSIATSTYTEHNKRQIKLQALT